VFYHRKLAAGPIASLKQIFPICTWTWCSHAVQTATLRRITNTHVQLKRHSNNTAGRNLTKPVATASRHAKLTTTSLHALTYLSFSVSRGFPRTFWLPLVCKLRFDKCLKYIIFIKENNKRWRVNPSPTRAERLQSHGDTWSICQASTVCGVLFVQFNTAHCLQYAQYTQHCV